MRQHNAFTLIELLVVIAIITILIGLLMPAMGRARAASLVLNDLANIRNMELAHSFYMADNHELFINVGLAHGGAHSDEDVAWVNTLEKYYGSPLLARSPLDDSPHWGPAPEGEPIPGGPSSQRRRTSYGLNNFVTDLSQNGENPFGAPPPGFTGNWPGGNGNAYDRLNRIPRPSATIHFLIMAFEGPFAGADHPHVENWMTSADAAATAGGQVQTNAVSGELGTADAKSNWGFLDGHAESAQFWEVFQSVKSNNFDPRVAR